MLFGYARTSTAEQAAGFEAQRRELKEAGCKKVFGERVSSVATRAKLEDAIDYVREGDVVTKLERRRATCTQVARQEDQSNPLTCLSSGLEPGQRALRQEANFAPS